MLDVIATFSIAGGGYMIGIIGGVQAILEHKRTEICYRCWK
jgi:hypothetical protein